jgi:hypothetical protein
MKPSAGKKLYAFAFWWGDHGLSALTSVMVLLFFLKPVFASPLISVCTSLFFSLMLISGVASVSRNRNVRLAAGVLAAVAIGLRWLADYLPSPPLVIASGTFSLIFLVCLTVVVMIRVFGNEEDVTAERVRGAIVAYLLFGVCWTIIYQLLDLCLIGAFNMPAMVATADQRADNMVYFSFVTLTTLGYGDITAVDPLARLFVILEALIGQLYPATLLARLVSLQVPTRKRKANPAESNK